MQTSLLSCAQNREVEYGEEMTMDYCSVTTSVVEWNAAICLCGMTSCRGRFLQYTSHESLQQVLKENYGPLHRFAALLESSAVKPMKEEDEEILASHGFGSATLGEEAPRWVRKYAADILRFVEFERKALPCKLMRSADDGLGSFYYADMSGRSNMEQRIQSIVCCFSLVDQMLAKQPLLLKNKPPIKKISFEEATNAVWKRLAIIPSLLEKYLLRRSDNEAKRHKIETTIQYIQSLVQKCPSNFMLLRPAILSTRQLILEILPFATATAR